MAEAVTTGQFRAAIADAKLWEYAIHLRRLLQDSATIETAESLEAIRQVFENLLSALIAIVNWTKKCFLSVDATAYFQEIQRFAFYHLELARSLLDKNGIEITKIPRDLAPEKPAISAAPPTPRPPSTPVKFNPSSASPFKGLQPPVSKCS